MAKQGRKTSVSGTHYVLHLGRPGYPKYVWCGRLAETVNRTTDETPREELCRACVRCAALGKSLSTVEVVTTGARVGHEP